MSEVVHKFICSNGHYFYVPLNLPQPVEKVGQLFKRIRCPYCRTSELNLHFRSFEITEVT